MRQAIKYFLIAFALVLMPLSTRAQEYPSRSISLIVPSAVGAWDDASTRIVAKKMEELLGQSIIILNLPIARGKIGTDDCIRAKPDGYTICSVTSGYQVILAADSIAAGESPPYEPGKHLLPIGQMVENQFVIVTNKDVPAKNLTELAAYVRANSGKVSFGTQGPSAVLMARVLNLSFKPSLDIIDAPYAGQGGEPRVMSDLLGGHIQVRGAPVATVKSLHDNGRLNVICVVGKQRSKLFPDVSTCVEQGASGFGMLDTYSGLSAPLGTPPEIIRKLNLTLGQALNDPEVQETLSKMGMIPKPGKPEVLSAFLSGIPNLAAFMKENHISLFGK